MYAKSLQWAAHIRTPGSGKARGIKGMNHGSVALRKLAQRLPISRLSYPGKTEGGHGGERGAEAPEIDGSAKKDEIIRAREWETAFEGRDKEREGRQKERGFKLRGRK